MRLPNNETLDNMKDMIQTQWYLKQHNVLSEWNCLEKTVILGLSVELHIPNTFEKMKLSWQLQEISRGLQCQWSKISFVPTTTP